MALGSLESSAQGGVAGGVMRAGRGSTVGGERVELRAEAGTDKIFEDKIILRTTRRERTKYIMLRTNNV